MPKPRPDETQKEFVARAIPILVKERHSQLQSVAIAYSMWREHLKKKHK